MKKLFAILLAVTMMMAMATNAFAATVTEDNGTQNIDVNAKYNGSFTPEEKISVKVEWGAMEFTYNVNGTQTWNPDSHTYTTNKGTPKWTATGNTVKVTNHSNVAVNATFTYNKVDENVTGTFDYDNSKTADANGTIALAAGELNKPNDADYVTATLTLDGTLTSTSTTNVKVGTIIVKITK